MAANNKKLIKDLKVTVTQKGVKEVGQEIGSLGTKIDKTNTAAQNLMETFTKLPQTLKTVIVSANAVSNAFIAINNNISKANKALEGINNIKLSTSNTDKFADNLLNSSASIELFRDSLAALPAIIKELSGDLSTMSSSISGISTLNKNLGNLKTIKFSNFRQASSDLDVMAKSLRGVKIASGDSYDALARFAAMGSGDLSSLANLGNILSTFKDIKIPTFKNQATNLNAMNTELLKVVGNLDSASSSALDFEGYLDLSLAKVKELAENSLKVNIPEVKGMDKLIDQMEELLNIVDRLAIEMDIEMRASTDALVEGLDNISSNASKTATVTDRLGNKIDKYNKTSEDLQKMQNRVAKTGGSVGKSFSDIAKFAGPLPQLYAVIFANLYALNTIYEALSSGDRITRLEKLSSVFGATLGVNIKGAAIAMQELTGGALSYEDALKQATTGAGYGFSTKDLEQMTLVARRASVVLGVDMVDAMNRVTRGVSKQEIEILDELGITIRLNEAYAVTARQLGKNVDSLSSYQKQHSYLQAVIKQSTDRFGEFDKQLEGTEYEKLGASVKSLGYSFLQLSADALRPAVSGLSNIIAALQGTNYSAANTVDQVDTLVESFNAAKKAGNITSVASLGSEAISKNKEVQTTFVGYKKSVSEYYKEYTALNAKLAEAQKAEMARSQMVTGNIFDTTAATTEQKNETVALGKQVAEAWAKYVDASKSVKGLQNSMEDLNKVSEDTTKYFGFSGDTAAQSADILAQNLKGVEQTTKTVSGDLGKVLSTMQGTKTPTQQLYLLLKDVNIEADDLDESAKAVNNHLRDPEIANALKKMYDAIGMTADKSKQLRDNLLANVNFDLAAPTRGLNTANLALSQVGNGAFSSANNLAKLQQELDSTNESISLQQNTYKSLKESQVANSDVLQGLNDELTRSKTTRAQLETQIKTETIALASQQLAYAATNNQVAELISNLDSYKTPSQELIALTNRATEALNAFNQAKSTGSPDEQASAQLAYYQAVRAVNEKQQEIVEYKQREANLTNELATTQAQLNMVKTGAIDYDRVALDNQIRSVALAKQQFDINKANKLNSPLEDLQSEIDYNKQLFDLMKSREEYASQVFKKQQDYYDNTRQASIYQETEAETAERKANAQERFVNGLKEANAISAQTNSPQQYSQSFIDQQSQELARLKAEADRAKLEREKQNFGAVNGAGGGYQYTDTRGMGADKQKIAMMGQGMQDINNVFSNLSSYNEDMGTMIGNLNGLANGFVAMGQGATNGLQVASAGLQSLSSIIQFSSSQTMSSIQDQIDAEKSRDGKSAESVAKINKLETKRIEVQKKSAAASIAINTAQGIMMAMGTLPYPYNLVQAGAVALMGAMAYQQAMSAKPNLTQVDSGVESLTLGSRSNTVDVSKAANAGELSYIQGNRGSGSIQNFTPRAEGGSVTPGVGYIVGEKGPEPFYPSVAGTIGSSSSSSNSSANTNIFQIHAIDSKSFEDLVMNNPGLFTKAVERDMNEKGKSIIR